MRRLRTLVSVGFVAGLLGVALAPIGSQAAGLHPTLGKAHASSNAAAIPVQMPPAQYLFHTIDNPADKTFNQLLGINDNNVIAGYFGSGTPPTSHPNKGYLLYWPYTHSNFSAENFPNSQQTQAIGVNNAGHVVGFWADAAGNNFGFTDVKGSFKKVVDPKTPKSGTPVNQLLGINNHDVAAGFYVDKNGNAHAYTYDLKHKSFHAVNPPHATAATAAGVNDKGDVTGFLTKKNGDTAAFLERGGHFSVFEFPGSTNTTAFGLNNSDVVVGSYVDKNNQTHGFIHAGGLYQSIDDPNGAAGTTLINGINNHDSIVGFSTDAQGNTNGFEANPAWSYTFQTLNNSADLTFNQLLGINDSGVIAGYYGSGTPPTTHPNKGYVLTPPYGQNHYKKENFPHSQQTQVTGINNQSDTVGFWVNAQGVNVGFTDIKGHFTSVVDPQTPAQTSRTTPVNQLLGINNHRVAAGFYVDLNGNAHGYTYDLKHNSFHAVTPPHSTSVTATGINDKGEVSGFLTEANGNVAAFLQHDGPHYAIVEYPGSTNTMAFGVNNSGQMVGTYTDAQGKMHGFIYTDGTFQSLDAPNGIGSTVINGLNNNGNIVGFYTDAAGNTDGFEAAIAKTVLFSTVLSGKNNIPATTSTGSGVGNAWLNPVDDQLTVTLSWSGLSSNVTAAHIHNAAVGQNGPVATDANGQPIAFTTPAAPNVFGSIGVDTFQLSQSDVQQLEQGNYYINIHTTNFVDGELRGQLIRQG